MQNTITMKAVLRGAISAENNEKSIKESVSILWDNIVSVNNVKQDEISCIIFSQTKDLTAINCAAALRKEKNITDIPLFCVQEADTLPFTPLIIRILIITDRTINNRKEIKHVYMRRATQLRPDISTNLEASKVPCLTIE